MKHAIKLGFLLAALAIALGVLDNSGNAMLVGAVFYGSSLIAWAIHNKK